MEDGRGQPAFLIQQSQQQMFYINLLISVLNGDGLGRTDGLLHFFGKSIEVHRLVSWLDAKPECLVVN